MMQDYNNCDFRNYNEKERNLGMVDRLEKNECNGCKMCKDICSLEAISYKTDREGFWYPVVDYEKCISCGMCIARCPNRTPVVKRTQMPKVYAAWSKDPSIRLASTSGGIFYELARVVLSVGGYVTGCIYDEDFKGAHQTIIHKLEELPPLMVSKYVQSDTEGIYRKTRDALKTGKLVLFVGSPCHCAGLVSFLGKEYNNLIICDFLCRGANSPKAHKKYVEYLENRYQGKIVNLRSKDKRDGWNHFGQSAVFDNGKEYYADRKTDLRIIAYHYGNLMMRESCHDCKFKHIPRDGADITLADFWGIASEEVDDIEKGISLVMVNSKQGERIFDMVKARIGSIEKTLQDAEKGNSAIYESAERGKNRDIFLSELDEFPFDLLVEKYRDLPYREKFLRRAVQKAWRMLKR